MRLVFMGSADFAVPSLKALCAKGHEILLVVTQPDRPQGRGRKLKGTPVKELAQQLGLPLAQPERVRDERFIESLRALQPEVIVVVAYGQILPAAVLEIPARGCINVHASLLPRYRGAAPVAWAIMQGEQETGVTTMLMDEGMDTGDILLQARLLIPPRATAGEVEKCLAEEGAELLLATLERWEKGEIRPVRQNAAEATYAPLLRAEHERIDWSQPALVIYNLVRALNPRPGAHTYFGDRLVKVWQAEVTDCDSKGMSPGEVLKLDGEGLVVQTGKGCLRLLEVQPAGRPRMSAAAFGRGYGVKPGVLLGETKG